jgi:phosphoribosylaminoimidazolecarboxamide formyltransferase/IMP cyclohydrolase
VVAAPSADDAAKAVFAKKKNLRLLLTGDLPDPKRGGLSDQADHRWVAGPVA